MILLIREYFNIIDEEKTKEAIEESLVELNLAREKLESLKETEEVLKLDAIIADKEIELNKLKESINEKYNT